MDGAGTPSNLQSLFAKARENVERLNACPRHLFETLTVLTGVLDQRAVCDRCGGSMPALELNQYVRGYEAHGGNGNDIVPGWKDEPGTEAMPQPLKRAYFTPNEE